MKDKTNILDNYLNSLGHDLESIGVKGKALYKKDALAFIDLIRESEVAILGGDVFFLKSNGVITMTLDNWYCNRDISEGYGVYVQRSVDVADRYIQGYDNALFDISTILFEFVLDTSLEVEW